MTLNVRENTFVTKDKPTFQHSSRIDDFRLAQWT